MAKKQQPPKSPSKGLDIKAVGAKIQHFFSRFQYMIFFIILGVGIAVAILMIISLFTNPQSMDVNTEPALTNSQKETAESLQDLESSDSPRDIPRQSGRFSPFFEGGWDSNIK